MFRQVSAKFGSTPVSNALLVWNWQTQAWGPVSTTVFVGANPPGPSIGQLYLDAQPKLWVSVDDWTELTMPIIGGPTVPNGAPLTASLNPPQNPASGALWFEPTGQNLSTWNGFAWIGIGAAVQRNVRIGHPLGTWNAGGNRTNMARAGDLLYVAGMRGIDPLTQQQVPGPGPAGSHGTIPPNLATDGGNARMVQTYQNIKTIVEAEGLSMYDCLGITTALTSAHYIGPSITPQALPQFWGLGPYPPRTHEVWLQMSGSDTEAEFPITGWPARGDIIEVTSLFYTGRPGKRCPTSMADDIKAIPGVSVTNV